MIAPDAAEMSTVLASSMPRYPFRMLRPTRPTSARMAQIRSMFHPLSGQPLDPVDGRVRRLRVRAVVRAVGIHGPAATEPLAFVSTAKRMAPPEADVGASSPWTCARTPE